MQERWRVLKIIEIRIKEQLDKEQSVDKSEVYGICTNLSIMKEYIQKLYTYVIGNI